MVTSAGDELLVITPWYPNRDNPYAGGFVRESVRAVAPYFRRTTIIHVENRPPDDDRAPEWFETAEGPLLWIGVPMQEMTSRADMMLLQREAMRAHALDLIRAAAVIHCHVGAPTGAGLVDLLRPQTRLVLTEHATYLPRVLRNPDARELYTRAVDRAQVLTAVGRRSAATIEKSMPGRAGRLVTVPNPVPLESFTLRPHPPASLSRWLFIGNLVPHKGCGRLIRAFAGWAEESAEPDARLTIVGQGVQQPELASLARTLGVAGRVAFAGPVEPDRIGQVYRDHDVLVHLSQVETFGLTCVEAAASGLAVLATGSGGPEETLAVHAALGLAEIVPVAEDTEVADVVAGMNRLAASVAAATPDDLLASRDHLERCYGAATVGSRLHAALAGTPQDAAAGSPHGPVSRGGGVRVLGVAVIPKHVRAVEASLREVAALGGGGVYLTTQPVGRTLPDSIEVVDISAMERDCLPSRLERAVVLRGPGLVLRILHRAARVADGVAAVGRPPGRLGARDRRSLAQRVGAVQDRHRLLARRFRWGPYAAFWRIVGPWYVARRLEGDGILQAVGLDDFDGLVVSDDHMVPVAVRVLRIRPELEVQRRWSPATIARTYAERSRRVPTGASRPGETGSVGALAGAVGPR